MADDAITKEEGGIRIKWFPEMVLILALTSSGAQGLKLLTNGGSNLSGVRSRYGIFEKDWPIGSVRKLANGAVCMIAFNKEKEEWGVV